MMVPREHLLRKIDNAVDFTHIYDFVDHLYCENNGRPGVDPVVLFKMVLIQHLYGIRSLRQTVKEIEMNIAYRWFLGYRLSESIPHFATVSVNFKHRYTSQTVELVFRWILSEAQKAGYLSPEAVFVDATHIKANANLNKKIKQAIPEAARVYDKQLRDEIDADREEHGKPPLDGDGSEARERTVTVSTTDPESGLFHKGEHKKCFAYGAHTVCDKHNFILGVEVTPGNVHDSVVFDAVYDTVTEAFPQVQVVTADAGYKTPWICKRILDDGRIPSLPYRRPMTKEGNHPWYEYVYDEYYDCILCPQYQPLAYCTTNRDGYREYKSKPYRCKDCPTRAQCTLSRNYQKTVTRHIWHDYLEQAEDIRHSPLGRETYSLRSQTIERVFADAKEKHAMRFTYYRGLDQVTKWVKLKYAAMNLKKLATWRFRLSMFLFLSHGPRLFTQHSALLAM
jgi:transposase